MGGKYVVLAPERTGIEVDANGLSSWHGAQQAVDATITPVELSMALSRTGCPHEPGRVAALTRRAPQRKTRERDLRQLAEKWWRCCVWKNTRHMLGSGGKCGSEQQAKHGPLAKCRRQRAASLHREGSGQAQASAEEAGEAQCGVSVEGERSRAVSTQENLDALRAEPDSLGEGPDARTGGPSCATQHRPHRGSRLCKMSIFFRADQRSRRSLHTSAPSVADASPNPDGFRLACPTVGCIGRRCRAVWRCMRCFQRAGVGARSGPRDSHER